MRRNLKTVMKMTKKRLLSAVLISAVVIYAVVFIWSFLEYRRYVVDTFELYEELGVPPGYIDVYPYLQWNYGGIVVGMGIVLVLCVIGGSVAFKGKRTECEKEEVKNENG